MQIIYLGLCKEDNIAKHNSSHTGLIFQPLET